MSLEETLVESAAQYIDRKDPLEKAARAVTRKHPRDVTLPMSATKPTAATLHQVNLRDQGKCQFETPEGDKCLNERFTEIHHLIPRAYGGSHEPENLTTLCSGHHRAIHHKGVFQIVNP